MKRRGKKKKAICLSPKPLTTMRYTIHESSGQLELRPCVKCKPMNICMLYLNRKI